MAAGATYEPIATQTLASAAASITFSSIAASWTDLRLVLVAAGTTLSSGNYPTMRFNGNSATNYSITHIYGDGSTVASSRSTGSTYINLTSGYYTGTTIPTLFEINLFSYAGSTYKTILSRRSNDQNGTGQTNALVGLWRSTAAITSITIDNGGGDNYAIGTTATLWGIKSA